MFISIEPLGLGINSTTINSDQQVVLLDEVIEVLKLFIHLNADPNC